jgi:hypothetical protein
VPRKNDDACRAMAERISRSRPQWLVVWGVYSQKFWAYPLFQMHPRMLVHAVYPDALVARMDEAEKRYRVRPEQEEAEDDPSVE